MQTLFTPWRLRYVSVRTPSESCFLCAAAAAPQEAERLVVHVTPHHLVILNRHPYTNGHVMVAPKRHVALPADCDGAESAEFWPLVQRVQRVLEKAYAPDGFNLGMNVGSSAGAGLPDHFHFHVVPRWQGDTNFMSVLGGIRVVPEDPLQVRSRLEPLFAGGEG